ncbi:MAG: NAD-glutamate dehydrogenase [bacterium]
MNQVKDGSYINNLLNALESTAEADLYPLLEVFARTLWSRSLEEDVAARDVRDDVGGTIEAFEHLRKRQSDDISFLLKNPIRTRDGWQSEHSVVVVAAPNMPFMVDSVLMALSHDGLVTHHLNNAVFAVERDAAGTLTTLSSEVNHQSRELIIYAEIDRLDDDAFPQLQAKLEFMARDLQAAVTDFGPMKEKMEALIAELKQNPPPLDEHDINESIAFLEWLLSNHFTFLGLREFQYSDGFIRQAGTALGTQRVRPAATARKISDQPQRVQDFLFKKKLLTFSKSGTKSRVHRPAYPDYVGIKQFDAQGRVIGETGFLGLYTSRVYMESPEHIPVVRHKVSNVMQRSGLDPSGFDGKVLRQVLATYPRDELFQITETELFETTMVITDIHERRRVRVFARYDAYGLFVNTLVYMPRDLFSTSVRLELEALLVETFAAEDAEYDILLSESILIRVQFILRVSPGHQIQVDRVGLEKRIAQLIGDWNSELFEALVIKLGERTAIKLRSTYADAFSAGYRESFSAIDAIDDIQMIEQLSAQSPLSTRLYRKPGDPAEFLYLKIFHCGQALPLSDVVPKLENLDLRVIGEHPYIVARKDQGHVSIQVYELRFVGDLDLKEGGEDLNEAFINVWNGLAEDDSYNRLILRAGLSWRQVSVLRAFAQYMKQIRFGFSQAFISDALFRHAATAALLVDYFERKFAVTGRSSAEQPAGALDEIRQHIFAALDAVDLLNEDRILRRFLELMDASKRTNYFVTDAHGGHRPFLSIKFMPREISAMPLPVPLYEIFVSAPYLEGVHLRAGSIARGGLRWSDRLEDYRTEVLGLVKAQVVKNAVIVPTGAKGGFVIKDGRPGVEGYKDFIRALLDVTDNIVNGDVTTPAQVAATDDPDPYFVVAADKGTATFSDTANEISQTYDFWLGDAFASGGSNGYDHKKMGITARGAWVSVQRHFAEMNIDVQTDPITVLGIGDMSGDVFGNGVLRSQSLLLVAAFNHQHIFIDPNPDALVSYAERQRLFNLPRSSWSDYNAELISQGGGVFSRTSKRIMVTPEMSARFGISQQEMAPEDLIHELLKSPVALIWNGGIGTYVKASTESHEDVGDRGNDHLRVNADELKAQVIGEGGNLGITQRARVEFALHGGAVNTDFIDNSAGVDCSDHEVNIKIVLNELVAREDLTRKQRNSLLESMTDEVAALVLSNSFDQAQTLSLAIRHEKHHQSEYQRLMAVLAANAGLNRTLEFLPSDETLAERYAHQARLTRPELAVLLTYTKTYIKNSLIAGAVHADPLIAQRILSAFPTSLVTQFEADIRAHRLAPEIIATQLANEIVDHMGITFVSSLAESVGCAVTDVAKGYAVAAACFDFPVWFDVVATATGLNAQQQLHVLDSVAQLGSRSTRWILRNCDLSGSLDALVSRFKPALDVVAHAAVPNRTESQLDLKVCAALEQAGLPAHLAQHWHDVQVFTQMLPVVAVAERRGCDVAALVAVSSSVGAQLRIDWLISRLTELPAQSHWQALQVDALYDDLFRLQCMLSAHVLNTAQGDFSVWQTQNPGALDGWFHATAEAQSSGATDIALFALIVRRLADSCAKLGC